MPTPEEEAAAQQAALLAAYGATPQDRERIGFPNFTYPPEDQPAAEPRSDSFMAGGPGWLSGLTGLGRPQTPAAAIPPALAVAPPQRPIPAPWRPETVEPRLAMPTQEVHTEPAPPRADPGLVLDERVNPPTPTERQGLEGDMVSRMAAGPSDPVALMGYGPGVIDWEHGIAGGDSAGVLGQYMNPRHPDNLREGIADRIFLQRGLAGLGTQPGSSFVGPRQGDIVSNPDLPEIGTHEFRHRGYNAMRRLAEAYDVPFDYYSRALRGVDPLSEDMNIYADRMAGIESSYRGRNFGRVESSHYGPADAYLRTVAQQINRRRVQDMNAGGVSWEQTNRTMRR
jgi:hypothetical protein